MPHLTVVDARFWRMMNVRWQREPLSGAGAAAVGGRWNRPGTPALYLAADHMTAVSEYNQILVKPGTLVAYDVRSPAVVDLTDPAEARRRQASAVLLADWRSIYIEGGEPESWAIADRLIEAEAHGALIPSAQNPGGTNLVLWRWSADGAEGARVRVIDPQGDLRRR